MLLPVLAALILSQAVPIESSDKSRSGSTGAPLAAYRMGIATGGSCLGNGATPVMIPFGATVTVTATQSVVLCWLQGNPLKASINTTSLVVTTVGVGAGTNSLDGPGSCWVLQPAYGVNGVTQRLENFFKPRTDILTGLYTEQPGRAKGVCATGGNLATGVTNGRPCFVDANCTGSQTCVLSEAGRAKIRGAYLCGRSSEGAVSVKAVFDY